MADPELWFFAADTAREAAHEVVHHAPDTPWRRVPLPSDSSAAAASITALAAEFELLPPSIRGALGRATSNAAQLSDDRLQGLAELLQNADDVGATTAFFHVEEDRLLFGHNGTDLTLPDVWGLTIPWLSEKSDKAETLGRFGIGLKTLQSLSETLEAHNGYFHLSLGRSTLTEAAADPAWRNRPEAASTVFVVPFQHGATTEDEVSEWLAAWGDAGLLFLRTLRSVSILDAAGETIAQLCITRSHARMLSRKGGDTTRTEITAPDGRTWLLYARSAPSPGGRRAGKAQSETTPVAVAFPRFLGDKGHIHVGLPVRPVGLPFRIAGQFDPLANRRDIAESQWNLEILGLVAALWVDAALDLFSMDASRAWAAVPLHAEVDVQGLTTGRVHEALKRVLMHEARLTFAHALRLDGGEGSTHALSDLSYETPDLTGILSDADIRGIAGTAGVITLGSRSDDDRWRTVLSDLEDAGARTPTIVSASSAVRLLHTPEKSIEFISDLTAAIVAAAVAEGGGDPALEAELLASPCLVLVDGARFSPSEAKALRVLLPEDPSALWSKLKIGVEVHPAYRERPSWRLVAGWLQSNGMLRRTATDEDALHVLATAGRDGVELSEPLSDGQADALRAALETVEESMRPALGAGIGKAVRLEATVYGADGGRTRIYARPVDAYFIEKEKKTWSVAARRTPGLVWLHRRYSEDLRAETGRAGIGAQRLFRLLGAESVPRLEALPDEDGYYKRYKVYADGLLRDAPGSPARRKRQMTEVGAQCTLEDLASPDLDKVLVDIAGEKSAAERRRRALALLGCLARNWDRLEPHAKVTAANPDNGWVPRGEVDAWWVNQAASLTWLANGRGRPTAPGELRLKTVTNEAMHGTDAALYLADGYDQPTHREVLTALGVEGNPTVSAIIGRLTEIRTAHLAGRPIGKNREDVHPMTLQEASDLAAPLYQALAIEVQGTGYQRRVGNMQAGAARAHFDRGDGLIITNLGWRRTSLTRSGVAVFGDLEAFVPAIQGAEPLWTALGVRAPDADDAKRVLALLARRRLLSTDERQVMLEALRLLARAPVDRRGQLRRQPVYVGNGWVSRRPVYAVANPLLSDALSGKVPIWQPGGHLTQLLSLIEPLALTKLDSTHGRVLHEHTADYDADLTATFMAAVRNLQTDLAVSAPATAATLRVTWDEFAAFQVALLPNLRVSVDLPDGRSHHAELAAWLDPAAATVFVTSPSEASRARTGGYAIASLFDADPREVSHAWVVAWSEAEAGTQTELVISAADRAAEEKRRREASHAALLGLLGPGMDTRKPKSSGKGTGTTSESKPGASTAQPAPKKARTLVDLEDLVLFNAEGEIVTGAERGNGATPGKGRGTGSNSRSKGKLRGPDLGNPKKPGGAGHGHLNYTAEERETAGLELLRRVLGEDGTTLTDVRHQPNVGADAVDDKGRYYELKVHAGAIPDTVRLENSQVERALTTDNFYLVLVGNVETGQGDPEVRIIHDPLHHLTPAPQGAVNLTGVLGATVARSWTFSRPQNPLDG